MDQILTQEEINALLDTASAEQGPSQRSVPQSVKPYDFRSPDKFSKDQVRAFQSLHEGYARALGASWSASLRSTVRVRVMSVEAVTYGDFVHALPPVTVISIFSAPPLRGVALLEMRPEVAFPMIDRLLGGTGEPLPQARELTEIERTLVGSVIERSLHNLAETWQGLVEMKPQLEGMEMNLEFTPIMAENEAVLLIQMEVSVNDHVGQVSLCLPAIFLEDALPKLTTQAWMSGASRHSAAQAVAWQENLREVALPVIAYLGKAQLPLADVMNLREGDVILLDQNIKRPIEIALDQEKKFFGHAGTVGRNLAVQVTEVVRNDE
jgi:flagellar motor switch protein FliM